MVEDGQIADELQQEVASEETPQNDPAEQSFVRPARPRRTVEAIDDFAVDDADSYTHDSDFTNDSVVSLGGRGWRRSRSDMGQLQQDLRYGQYLEVPKSRRSIFTSRTNTRGLRTAAAIAVVVAVLAVIAFVAWNLISQLG